MSEQPSNYAVKVENLSKVYDLRINHRNFRESITESIKDTFHRKQNGNGTIQALDGISFQLQKGEVLGIIGKNGAGKSTLLKILSEITEPTQGSVYFNGTVASILDIGTGFHEELTGKENIFLRGTILGMSRQQIKDQFNAIVSFSGIGKFVDAPVKHYSNGMFIRLAFSVATHFNADILLLDEVLAVGDAGFSIKSFNKIKSLVKEGKTILIVSHNLSSISNLCSKCLILEEGKMKAYGSPKALVDRYTEETLYDLIDEEKNSHLKESEENLKRLHEDLKRMQRVVEAKENALRNSTTQEQRLQQELEDARTELENKSREEQQRILEIEAEKKRLTKNIVHVKEWENEETAPGNNHISIKKVSVRGKDKTPEDNIFMNESIVFELEFYKKTSEPFNLSFLIRYQLDMLVMSISTILADHAERLHLQNAQGFFKASCFLPAHLLNHGIFTLDIHATDLKSNLLFSENQLLNFKIHLGNSQIENGYEGKFTGPLFPKMKWEIQQSKE